MAEKNLAVPRISEKLIWPPLYLIIILVLVAFGARLFYFHINEKRAGELVTTVMMAVSARSVTAGQWPKFDEKLVGELAARGEQIRSFDGVPSNPVETFSKPWIQDVPGYSLLIAGTWKIFGHQKLIYIQWIQMTLDSLAVILIFGIGAGLLGYRAGLGAAIIYAIFPPAAYLSVMPLRDIWGAWAAILMTWAFYRIMSAGPKKGFLIEFVFYSFFSSLFLWLRPTPFLLPVFLGIAAAFTVGWKKAAASTLIFMGIVFIVFYLPFSLYNVKIHGRWSMPAGQGLWEGMGEYPNPFGAVCSDTGTYSDALKEGVKLKYGTLEYDQYLMEKARKVIREHPAWYASTVAGRFFKSFMLHSPWDLERILLNPGLDFREYLGSGGTLKGYITTHPVEFVKRIFLWALQGFELLLYLLALGGAFIFRKQWRNWMPLVLVPVYFALLTAPLCVVARYMSIGFWACLPLAAITIISLYEKIFGRFIRRT